MNPIQTCEKLLEDHVSLAAGAALALGACTLDRFVGQLQAEAQRTEPTYHIYQPKRPSGSMIALPGCQMNGGMLHETLVTQFPDRTIVTTDYADQGFDVEQVCAGLAQHIRTLRLHQPSAYCPSMGGRVFADFDTYAEATGLLDLTEGFDQVRLDATPARAQDIRPQYKVALHAARILHDSWTANRTKPLFMGHGHEWSARTPLGAVAAQGSYLLAEQPVHDVSSHCTSLAYTHGLKADSVVDTAASYKTYQQRTGGAIRQIRDARPAGHHTSVTEDIHHLFELHELELLAS